MQRILVIYNPRSSQYRRVRTEVLDPLTKINGYMIGKYAIEHTSFEQNITKLKSILKDGDLVLAVGGDATAAIAANAILNSAKKATLAALPYGNFNDLSRTLGTKSLSDVLEAASHPAKLYPLDISVNDGHWRYATCYVTIGMTAAAVDIFDQAKVRKKLQSSHFRSVCSYFHLAAWYFKNRFRKNYLSEGTFNNAPIRKGTTDYFATNGKYAAHVMRGSGSYQNPTKFKSSVNRFRSFIRLAIFMVRSMFSCTPGKTTTKDVIKFTTPSTITIQAEGESKTFECANAITITKSTHPLLVVQK